MQQQSPTAAPRRAIPLDFGGHVSRHVARRVRQLVSQTQVWSVDGLDLRQYQAYRAASVRLPMPTLIRGPVGQPPRRHRVQLETDPYGVPLGSCDCRAAEHGIPCSHLWALAVWAVSFGWRSV
jgi:hypothetical protein